MSESSDSDTTVSSLKRRVNDFAVERDWLPFHSLKNLSMALTVEAGELMEHFQWLDAKGEATLLADEQGRAAIEEELADVVVYALQFANRAGTDLSSAIRRKMGKNAEKYPVDLARGSAKKR